MPILNHCLPMKLVKEAGTTESITYVIGEPVEFTLLTSGWNGTNYTLTLTDYESSGNVQIGIPSSSSSTNTERLIASALTIPYAHNNTDGDTGEFVNLTIIINAVYPPTEDIVIALFGLKEVIVVNE